MYKIDMSADELESRMKEIEDLQKQVDDILYNKNPFIRFFRIRKAMVLHEKANMKMLELFYPTYKEMKKNGL